MDSVDRLLEIMARLRDPGSGCPWDLEQRFETIAPHTIEEAYEVDDAIRRGDLEGLREELGDLLLQVAFHAQMAREAGRFDFEEVARGICEKLVRRHPHVFGQETIESAEAQTRAWEAHKAVERARAAAAAGREPHALDGVALALPALLRAAKLLRRAERAALTPPSDGRTARAAARVELEALPELPAPEAEAALGRLLLACVRVAQALGVDPERALREEAARFETRLRGTAAPR
jgi:MazG family protein